MPDEPSEITQFDHRLDQIRLWASIEFNAASKSADVVFNVRHFVEPRGLVSVDVKESTSDVSNLSYVLQGEGLERVRRIQFERDLRERCARDKPSQRDFPQKWGALGKRVDTILDLENVLDITETLRSHGQIAKGTVKFEQQFLDTLSSGLTEQFLALSRQINTRPDGAQFVRLLLRSGDEERVRLGMFLIRDYFINSLIGDLIEVFGNQHLTLPLRRMAYSLLPVEVQRASPARLTASAPSSLLPTIGSGWRPRAKKSGP